MSEQQQINKLRAQMSALKSNIEELNLELKKSDETVIDITIERDLYYKQLQEAQMKVKNIDEIVKLQAEEKVQSFILQYKEMSQKQQLLAEEIALLKNTNKEISDQLDDTKALNNKLIDENKLLINKAKGDPKQYMEYIMGFKDTRQQAMSQLDATNRKMNKLQVDMENILAENRILRKLAGVPENYGFDLEEIKSSEKNKIEDFKSQVRYLEREVEELEKERTQLRARLRDALTKQGKGGEDGFAMQKDESYMKTNKELKDQVDKLTKQLEMRGLGGNDNDDRKYIAQQNEQTLKTLKEYQEEMKKNIEQLLNNKQQNINLQNMPDQTLDQERKFIQQKEQVNQIIHQNNGQFNNHGMPPEALPGPFGNMSDIREGYSNKFQQKMPVDMYELYGESGFDQVQAKHEIAQLQLMNIELVRTLTNKTQEYTTLSSEIKKVREDLKVSLLIQDELFDQHYKQKQELKQEIDRLKEQKEQVEDSLFQLQKKYEILEQFRKNIENDSKDTLEDKLAQMSKRTAILDVNMIKLARKYQAVLDENTELSELVKDQESDYIERERLMKQKILELESWKRQAKTQLKLLLENAKKSITIQEYNTMVDMENIRNEQIAQLKIKLGSYEYEIAKLNGAERSLQDSQDSYRLLQEELVEINLEFDLIKKRLEDMDPAYKKFQQFFKKLVDFFKTCQESPLAFFQSIDENTDGKIGKSEFENLLKRVGVQVDSSELEVIFKFMDIDGSETLEYKEFLKKLRRAGINIRNENEQQIFNLYEHLKKAQLSLKDAFDLFDPDRSNTITRKEMEEAFKQVHIQVTPQTIDYVFKMADVSGEGQITFDEWRSLFENIIKDSIREDELMFTQKLDWKKEVMIKLDEGLRDANFQLIDLYKFMDLDENSEITIEEFRKLFYNLKVQLEPQEIQQLFQDIDKDDSHNIEYNELLNYIREARREQERIQRQVEIQKRAERMQNEEHPPLIDENNTQNKAAHLQGQLQMKLATLELREKNLTKRNEDLRKELNNQHKMNGRDKERIKELETSHLNSIQNYYKERDERIRLEILQANCETKERSEELNKINTKLQLEKAELTSALNTFKNLYVIAMDQCQILKLSLEKRKHEKEHLREAIKELQSQGDDKALMGKLFHQIMYSKWEKSEIGKKHEKLWAEFQQIKIDIANRDREIERQERENNIIHAELDERIQKYEREIANLKGKIIPTVNINKIEELYNKIGEITQLKLELEITNKKMRQENYEITLKCDYYETNQKSIQDLEKKLKSSYTDDIQIRLIDQSKEISNLKMSEMRALREAMMAKEKEEYYQRVNRQNTDILKNLENQVAEHQLRFTERENYWRNRCSQLLKSLSAQSDKFSALKTSEEEITQNLKNKQQEMIAKNTKEISFKNKDKKQVEEENPEVKEEDVDIKKQNDENKVLIDKLKKQIDILTLMVTEREQEIKDLKLLMDPELLKQHRNQRQESVQDAMKKVIDEEGQKMAQVAQKTIATLQNLIEEKNEQLTRKDRLIDKMRKDFMEEKQRDVDEIRRLSNQAISANMTANEKMRASFMANDGKSVMQNEDYWNEVGKVLQEKDLEMQKLKDSFEAKMQEYKKSKKKIEQLQDEVKVLEHELEEARVGDRNKGQEGNNKALQSLVKLKDKEINSFKSSLQQLKDEFIKSTVQAQAKEDEQDKRYAKVKAENNQLKIIQDKISKDIQTSNSVQKMLKDKLETTELKVIEMRGTLTELENENNFLRDELKKAGKLVEEKPKERQTQQQKIGEFFQDKTFDKEIKELKAKIIELEKENTDLNQSLKKISQNKAGELIDVNGFLQAKGMYFSSFQEICDTISQWIKLNPNYSDLMSELKKEDKITFVENKKQTKDSKVPQIIKENGRIPESKFYEILKIHRIILKDIDKQKLNKELIDNDGNIDIVKFYYHINGYNEDQKLTLIKHTSTETKEGDSTSQTYQQLLAKDKKQVDFEQPEEQKDQFIKTQKKEDLADLSELEQTLNKKILFQNSKLKELTKDKITTEKQMNEWRDKYYKLERETSELQNKLSSSKQPQIQRQASGITAVTMDLKDMVFQLEDQKAALESALKKKDRDLQRLEEEKKKLMDDIKNQKSEILKQKQKLDDIIKDKIGREQLISDYQSNLQAESDKDSIIIRLKKNLELQREKEQQMTEQMYELKIKNEDLEESKNKFDQQLDRLNRRIQDLEEFRKSSGQGGEQKGPFKTLKKPVKK